VLPDRIELSGRCRKSFKFNGLSGGFGADLWMVCGGKNVGGIPEGHQIYWTAENNSQEPGNSLEFERTALGKLQDQIRDDTGYEDLVVLDCAITPAATGRSVRSVPQNAHQ
jgi:hypothetical protein